MKYSDAIDELKANCRPIPPEAKALVDCATKEALRLREGSAHVPKELEHFFRPFKMYLNSASTIFTINQIKCPNHWVNLFALILPQTTAAEILVKNEIQDVLGQCIADWAETINQEVALIVYADTAPVGTSPNTAIAILTSHMSLDRATKLRMAAFRHSNFIVPIPFKRYVNLTDVALSIVEPGAELAKLLANSASWNQETWPQDIEEIFTHFYDNQPGQLPDLFRLHIKDNRTVRTLTDILSPFLIVVAFILGVAFYMWSPQSTLYYIIPLVILAGGHFVGLVVSGDSEYDPNRERETTRNTS